MKNRILSFSDYFFCIFLALAFSAAPSYLNNGSFTLSGSFALRAFVVCLIFLLSAFFLRRGLQNGIVHNFEGASRFDAFLERLLSTNHPVVSVTFILLAFWIIPLILLYPGTLINDSWGQLQQFISFIEGNGGLFDHHPLFDTLVMGILIVPLSRLTGQWHIMFFIYVLIQAFFTAAAFSTTVVYVYKKLHLSKRVALGMLLAYSLIPVFPAAVQTISKDALHSWIFVFYVLCYLELVRTDGAAFKDKWFVVKFTLIALFCCLTKKVGFFIVVLSLAVLFLCQRQYTLRLMIPVTCSIVLMYIAMPILMFRMNVISGGKQEMFSLPFQMSARYVCEHSDDISDEEYRVLDKVLTMDTLAERYDPTFADPVKEYHQKGTDQDYLAYLKVWFQQGLRHPGSYISATNAMLSGWFSWTEYAPLMNNEWRNQHNPELIPEDVPLRDISQSSAEAYQELYHFLYKFPCLNLFLSYGFYAALIPSFSVATVLRKGRGSKIRFFPALIPILFALFLGCWLAPASIFLEGIRYLYPVVYTSPLMIAWCFFYYAENRSIGDEIPEKV